MKTNKSKILTVVALPNEISKNYWNNRTELLYTGIGKINTCLNLINAIHHFKPDLIINLGTAGSLKSELNGIVDVSCVLERDFDASPLAERGRIPFENHENKFYSGRNGVICASGDSFVTETEKWFENNAIDIIDMELFAIAKISSIKNIPWISFKFISDYIGKNSKNEWNNSLTEAESSLIDHFDQFISNLS